MRENKRERESKGVMKRGREREQERDTTESKREHGRRPNEVTATCLQTETKKK